jgi:hypothetical protein
MDVEEEFKKLDDVEIKAFESNEEIKQLISGMRTTFRKIKLGGKEIRIKPYMPKQVRKRFLRVSKDLTDVQDVEGVEEIERRFYPLVAAMCVDAPYNESKTWQYLDEAEGCIQDVTMKIMAEINKADSDVKSFR